MSMINPSEDFQKAMNLVVGDSFKFNMRKDNGAMIKKVCDDSYEVYKIQSGQHTFQSKHNANTLIEAIHHAYTYWN